MKDKKIFFVFGFGFVFLFSILIYKWKTGRSNPNPVTPVITSSLAVQTETPVKKNSFEKIKTLTAVQNKIPAELKDKNEALLQGWDKLVGSVKSSPACIEKSQAASKIQLTPEEIFYVYRNQRTYSNVIILDPFRYCLKAGSEVDLFDIEPRGKMKIFNLELVQSDKQKLTPLYSGKLVSALKLTTWSQIVLDFMQSYDFSPVQKSYRLGLLINYSIKDKKDFLWEVAGSRRAPSISGVKYFLNESDVDKKAVIIDVRSELEFKYGSLKGAFNLPYSFNSSRGKSQPPNALSIFQDT